MKMKKIFIFIFVMFNSLLLYGIDETPNLMKLLNKSKDSALSRYYPSAIVGKYRYSVNFSVASYNQIIQEDNFYYTESGAVNINLKNIILAGGVVFKQFSMGNYGENEISGIIGSRVIEKMALDAGLSFTFRGYSYTSEYNDSILNDLNSTYFDLGFSAGIEVYKGINIGVGLENILNSEAVDGSFSDAVNIVIAAGYDLKDYGVLSIGFSRKEGANNALFSYGISYNQLYAQFDYDFNSIIGTIVLRSDIFQRIKVDFSGSIKYINELGTVYSGGINLKY